MILSVNSDSLPTLIHFCKNDPFGCKIASLANAYGVDATFTGFWLQYHEKQVTAAISRLDNAAVLHAVSRADFNEIGDFLSMLGIAAVQCKNNTLHSKTGKVTRTGTIMRAAEQRERTFKEERNPSLQDVYEILQSCRNAGFEPPPFPHFYVDMSHRIRHGAARSVGVRKQNILVSCALAVAQTDEAAVLGAVATRPENQKQGYGEMAVGALVSWLQEENKEIYLLCGTLENQNFYRHLGFADCGSWCEIYI